LQLQVLYYGKKVFKIEKRETKTMVFALAAVVLVAILALNFESTGKTVSTKAVTLTKVYVSSNPEIINQNNPIIKAGNYIYITVESGSNAISKEVKIVRKDNGLRVTEKPIKGCEGINCDRDEVGTATYKTPTSWYGNYCAEIQNRELNKVWQACFSVQ